MLAITRNIKTTNFWEIMEGGRYASSMNHCTLNRLCLGLILISFMDPGNISTSFLKKKFLKTMIFLKEKKLSNNF